MSKSATNFFGLTTFRNEKKKFGIKTDDRRRHFYCIGKTGMGKSNLMENMAIQDIQAGRGVAYVDPHGEGAEKLLDFVPSNRVNDVIFFNPADLDYPIAFNVMEKVDFRFRHLIAGGLMGVFKKVWPDVWSARMEYILNNSILALLEYPDATLLGVNRMLADPEYREKVVAKITDPIIRSFWVTEYARYTQRYEIEATAAIQNKVGQFISNPLIRDIIGQTKSTIDMRDIMDKEKIFIMDLSKGRIGEDNSRLLGALLITKLQLAAMSRVDIPEDDRKDFYLYVDEFQNFATESFANILSEARKYRLNITLGHQYITQMEEEVRDAVFGNVGTMAVFRVGAEDAEFLEREFSPQFTAEDLVNLPKYNIYLKLMIDGVAGHPFSAQTLPPPAPLEESNREKIIRASRERYGVKRSIVDEKISKWAGLDVTPTPGDNKGQPNIERPRQAQGQGGQAQRSNPQQGAHSGQQDFREGTQTTLYDAICSNCGKSTKVIFPPEKGRAVYCKSCLKKMKAGNESHQVKETHQESHHENKPAEKVVSVQAEQPTHERITLPKEDMKIEEVSFHRPKNSGHSNERPNEHKHNTVNHDRPKKEINLSELRKALEESLKNKEEQEEDEQEVEEQKENLSPAVQEKTTEEKSVAPADSEKPVIKSPQEQLREKIEMEKEMDKAIEEERESEENPRALPSGKNNDKKRQINPGETVKL